MSQGVEWALHSCSVLAGLPPANVLPASRLAEMHDVPPAYLAKHLQALSRAGILVSGHGPRGGYRLARPAREITVLDVVEAIDGDEPAFRCTEIRRRGPTAQPASAYRLACGIHRVMDTADAAWRESLRAVTVAELVDGVMQEASPAALAAGAEWIQEAIA